MSFLTREHHHESVSPPVLKPAARLLLWRLAAAGGGEWIGEIRPAPSAAVRKELADAGFAISEARRHPATGRGGTWIELTEAGWGWASGHMGEDIGASSAAGDTLTTLLRRLREYLAQQRLTAADVFRSKVEEAELEPVSEGELDAVEDEDATVLTPMVEVAIVRAYLRITEEQPGVRVLLTHLRQCVELSRPELDAALRRLAAEDRIVLETLEEDELSPEDHEAALAGSHGEVFHVVSMGA